MIPTDSGAPAGRTHGAVQLLALARSVGFSESQAAVMATIALAESDGNANAVGDQSLADSKWGPSYGLWQIRSLHAQRGTGKERDALILLDPQANARSARIVFGQQGLGAWSVYPTKSSKFYGEVQRAVGYELNGADKLLLSGPVDAVGGVAEAAAGGVLGGIDAIGAFFGALSQRGTWVRILQVVGGAGMVVGGLSLLGRDVLMPVASAAAKVHPAGAAVTGVTEAAAAAKAAKAAHAAAVTKAAATASSRTGKAVAKVAGSR